MRTRDWMNKLVSAAGFAALLAVGCQESTGGGLALVHVSMAQTGASSSAALAPQLVTTGAIDPAIVAVLTVQLDAVELQTSGSGWQRVDLASPVQPFDLKALPTTGSGTPIALGDVEVEAGACQARLFVSNPVIKFNQEVTVGDSHFDVDVDYGAVLRIPSGDQTGLKADGECTVAGSPANVTLAFDVGATVGTIAVTGSGSILLTPVVRIAQAP